MLANHCIKKSKKLENQGCSYLLRFPSFVVSLPSNSSHDDLDTAENVTQNTKSRSFYQSPKVKDQEAFNPKHSNFLFKVQFKTQLLS